MWHIVSAVPGVVLLASISSIATDKKKADVPVAPLPSTIVNAKKIFLRMAEEIALPTMPSIPI